MNKPNRSLKKVNLLLFLILFSICFNSSIFVSANIIDDFKNNFNPKKQPIKEKINNYKNQAEIEEQELAENLVKICNIRKEYAISHFTSRKEIRTKDIDQKISSINKVKNILETNKQDISILNSIAAQLEKSLNEKKKLLNVRVTNSTEMNCKSPNENNPRKILQDDNENITKIDKDIKINNRLFTQETRKLILSMQSKKLEAIETKE